LAIGFKVKRLGLRVYGSGFCIRVQGFEFNKVKSRESTMGLRVEGRGFTVQGLKG